MSAIIIGGNECMGRTYCDLCAKYNITARTIPFYSGPRMPSDVRRPTATCQVSSLSIQLPRFPSANNSKCVLADPILHILPASQEDQAVSTNPANQ